MLCPLSLQSINTSPSVVKLFESRRVQRNRQTIQALSVRSTLMMHLSLGSVGMLKTDNTE